MERSSLHKTYEPIPEELKKEKRWCLYKIIPRDGKNTKLPIMPNSKPAKSNDKSTWHSYEDCMKALSRNIGDGLGFFLGDGYIGIDIDKVSDEMMEYMVEKDANSMTADFLRGIKCFVFLKGSVAVARKGACSSRSRAAASGSTRMPRILICVSLLPR